MCPVRIILVFLSATLAGFFLIRNVTSKSDDIQITSDDEPVLNPKQDTVPRSTKVCSAICSGFWTCVDMASGRYLWKHLSSSSSKQQ